MSIKDKSNLVTLNQNQRALPAKDKVDPKKMQAAKMFENQFVRQMITEMRKTVQEEGSLIPDSPAQRIFKGKLDDEYADKWVESGGIGLSKIIYDQLEERYGNKRVAPAKGHSQEIMNVKAEDSTMSGSRKPSTAQAQAQLPRTPEQQTERKTSDIFHSRDKDLFLLKKTSTGYHIKSREPLPEHVNIQAPVDSSVVAATPLGEGKQMVVLSPSGNSDVSLQFVHTGSNKVQPGDVVKAGQTIAQLPASLQGEGASVLFGFRTSD